MLLTLICNYSIEPGYPKTAEQDPDSLLLGIGRLIYHIYVISERIHAPISSLRVPVHLLRHELLQDQLLELVILTQQLLPEISISS